jgi:hypothetical protein
MGALLFWMKKNPRKKIRQLIYPHSGDKNLHEKLMKPSWKYMS